MGKVKAKSALSGSVLDFILVVVLIVLACLLPMAGVAKGIILLREGDPRTAKYVVLGEIVIGLFLGAMSTHLLGDLVGADIGRRLNLWGSLFGLLFLLSMFYLWQFFYSPRAKRVRNAEGRQQWRRFKEEHEDDRDLDAYLERSKMDKARWKMDGGVRKPKGIEKVERTGWVRNMEGKEAEEVWRVETDFEETGEEEKEDEKDVVEDEEEDEGEKGTGNTASKESSEPPDRCQRLVTFFLVK